MSTALLLINVSLAFVGENWATLGSRFNTTPVLYRHTENRKQYHAWYRLCWRR